MTFEETLAEWMPTQRWFAGKGARILGLTIAADTVLLRDPSFARAVDDLRDFNSIDGFQETGSDTLTVSLTDAGITAPAAPHYLRRISSSLPRWAPTPNGTCLLSLCTRSISMRSIA